MGTGPLEDSVLFTSIPYDRFVYRVLSHPNPQQVGTEIELVNPRKPIQAMVERSFYNARIEEGSVAIDERIFEHRVGDIDSYKTSFHNDNRLQQFEGREIGPRDVGQGAGYTRLRLDRFTQESSEVTNGGSVKLDVKVTKGWFIGGFTVGYSRSASMRTTYGELTRYTGSVAHLDAQAFAESPYAVGMFIYRYTGGPHPIDVIDYWVER